jgi:type IV secretory pathway VirJ component
MTRSRFAVRVCVPLALAVAGAVAAQDAATPAANPAATPPRAHAASARSRKPAADASHPGARMMPAGRFGTVAVYRPVGVPKSVAIFVSGDGGWKLGVTNMARALRDSGAVVIGIDIRRYLASLRTAAQKPEAPCTSLAGDFETLSHRIQKDLGLAEYRVPVLVGYSSGATVVYATLVQSPPGTFEGAISLGFCSDQDFGGATLCTGTALHYSPGQKGEIILQPQRSLAQPWFALQGQKDQVCSAPQVDAFAAQSGDSQVVKLASVGHGFSVERNWMPQFLESYTSIIARQQARRTARPTDIDDLPVNEVRNPADTSSTFALLLTGDGGWAGLDQELAARLAAAGVATVGLNSLKYFWTQRPPQQAANDVARVIHHYLTAWNKARVLLVGYSFGADALPFIVNRLPADLKERVASVSLLGISANASFEIRVADWIGADSQGAPTRPELAALVSAFKDPSNTKGARVLCLYGEGDKDTICPDLAGGVTREPIGKGHHFSGEYAAIADKILAFARDGPPAT